MKKLVLITLALLTMVIKAQTIKRVGSAKTLNVVQGIGNGMPGEFTFTVKGTKQASAGVYKNDSVLVTTLWSNETFTTGTYTGYWDGRDDYGNNISSPNATYKIKVLTNAVKYTWQGTIGNTSDNMTGSTKHRGYYDCMRGLVFSGRYGYFSTGYAEGSASRAKFNTGTPNQKIIISNLDYDYANTEYVATDGTTVFWSMQDANAANNTWVIGTNVSNDAEKAFSSGEPYACTFARRYPYTISKVNSAKSAITGLAVQSKYLFVARSGMNQLQVLNKSTGALVQTLIYASPRGLSVDGSGNLWMCSGTNSVAKYKVNSDGSLTAAILTLSGLLDPLATQVSFDGTKIAVCDGSTSQQVKFFNNSTGTATSTLGTAGGYLADATVSNVKFYFNDARGNRLPFIAYQSDGSYWINDAGNYRVQHYTSSGTYVNRIMSLGATYNTWVDKNNVNRVFVQERGNYLEFAVDYSVQNLTGTGGWSLVNNWGANLTPPYTIGQYGPASIITLSNGHTYALIDVNSTINKKVVELVKGGNVRITGITKTNSDMLCTDGSLQSYNQAGSLFTYKRYPLTGFDDSNNPQWAVLAEILAIGIENTTTGNPVSAPNNQLFSGTNKIVLYQPSTSKGSKYYTGYHLGLMQRGATNSFQFQTERGTSKSYQGMYPEAGFYDIGNGVNNYSGSNVNIVDSNIVTGYHGEGWKGMQANKYNHYYLNGLAIGQFGTTRYDVGNNTIAAAGMAGNALSPILVKVGDSMYFYHGDEGDHGGLHRWKISGLNTIAVQELTINFPSAYASPSIAYTNLMAGLPNNKELVNNTSGWTRSPGSNSSTSGSDYWRVNTSTQSYKLNTNDITVEAQLPTSTTRTVCRDLGSNKVNTNWKLTGEVSFLGSNNRNLGVSQQFLEVLDNVGKVLTTFYIAGTSRGTSVFGNGSVIASSAGYSISGVWKLLPFEVRIVAGTVTFTYGNYTSVKTSISDKTGDWHRPTTVRLKFVNTGIWGTSYAQTITIKDFYFFKDF